MLQTEMSNLIANGYVDMSTSIYKNNFAKAFREVAETVYEVNGFMVGDDSFQSALNTTALSGLALSSTANAATKIQNIMDASTFINAGLSSNYTRQTTAAVVDGATTADVDFKVYTAAHAFVASPAATVKVNGVAVTTGFTVTNGSGIVTFTDALLSTDVVTVSYTYTISQPYLKATNPATNAVVVTNSVTISACNYAVLKTIDSGTVKYEISRDAGTTFKQIYPNAGKQLLDLPTGTSIVLKITITGVNSSVSKFGLSFR